MLDRVKRRLSRTKSVPQVMQHEADENLSRTTRALTLSPSDEHLISYLTASGESRKTKRVFISRIPSENPEWQKRKVFNDVSSGFLSLPTEILQVLKQYLTLSSEVTLRHSCSRFLNLYKTPAFYLAGPERFDFLCMTERDQNPSELDKLVCGRCKEVHPRIGFPSAEVKQLSTDRDCRQVWLCPHKHLGYQRSVKAIKAGAESPFRVETLEPCSKCRDAIRNRSVADRPERSTSEIDIESPKAQSLLISKIALMQVPLPSYNTKGSTGGSGVYKELFPVKEVSAALQAIDFRLCSHLKLGDPAILSKFCRACINTQKLPPGVKGPVCISDWARDSFEAKMDGKCKGACFTRGCKTKFMFQTRESLTADASGKRVVWLIMVVYRWLGPLVSTDKDLTWTEHSTIYEERMAMRKQWDAWLKGTKTQPCMPNWSICLLHPDDCNLR